jgi:Holliday junction DNA helicase RuvA
VIARLRGRLHPRANEEIIVDVGGVGYQVFVSAQTFATLPAEGSEVDLEIVTHLREDALQLFGFAHAAERVLFQLLLSVSGIGPRLAVNILSGMPTAELREAIRRRDLVRLTRIAGVGKKTAERLCVELTDKLLALPEDRPTKRDGAVNDVVAQAVSALVNLGFRDPEAAAAVDAAVGSGLSAFEDVVREALRSTRR